MKVYVDAQIVGKSLVVDAQLGYLERLVASLERDIATYGRRPILDIYSDTYLLLKDTDATRLDSVAEEDFRHNVIFVNACRAALHDIPVDMYPSVPEVLERPSFKKRGTVWVHNTIEPFYHAPPELEKYS